MGKKGAQKVDSAVRLTGTVKRFDKRRGFGFVSPVDGGDDIFCHWEEIATTAKVKWAALEQGAIVEYSLKHDEKKEKSICCNVTGQNGVPIAVDVSQLKSNSEASKFTLRGTVKMWDPKGFGFLTTDNEIRWPRYCEPGSDVYVTREELNTNPGSPCGLCEGMRVKFRIAKNDSKSGMCAVDVSAEDGTPLVKGKGRVKGFGKGDMFGMGKGYEADPWGYGGYSAGGAFGSSLSGAYGGAFDGKGGKGAKGGKGFGGSGYDDGYSKGMQKGMAMAAMKGGKGWY